MELFGVLVIGYLGVGNQQVTMMATLCEARVVPAPRQARLSLAEPMPYYFHNSIDGHPGTYSYGYDVRDHATGNTQFRSEERYPNGTVVGSYGYVDAWGRPQRYRYIADERGYRVMSDPIFKPVQTLPSHALYPATNPTESSISWTRPKKPNKNKKNNYVRPHFNLIGPPSLHAEDR